MNLSSSDIEEIKVMVDEAVRAMRADFYAKELLGLRRALIAAAVYAAIATLAAVGIWISR